MSSIIKSLTYPKQPGALFFIAHFISKKKHNSWNSLLKKNTYGMFVTWLPDDFLTASTCRFVSKGPKFKQKDHQTNMLNT